MLNSLISFKKLTSRDFKKIALIEKIFTFIVVPGQYKGLKKISLQKISIAIIMVFRTIYKFFLNHLVKNNKELVPFFSFLFLLVN